LIEGRRKAAAAEGVEMRLDYVEMNDAEDFGVLEEDAGAAGSAGPVIVSGALWVGRTRLIDNVLLNEGGKILSV
jgi:pantoate--beta-alanine ligase